MTEEETTVSENWQKIEDWRQYELSIAGYPDSIARKLARLKYVDLHEACGLLKRGCDPRTAYQILR